MIKIGYNTSYKQNFLMGEQLQLAVSLLCFYLKRKYLEAAEAHLDLAVAYRKLAEFVFHKVAEEYATCGDAK